jgi:hypothetical protein
LQQASFSPSVEGKALTIQIKTNLFICITIMSSKWKKDDIHSHNVFSTMALDVVSVACSGLFHHRIIPKYPTNLTFPVPLPIITKTQSSRPLS